MTKRILFLILSLSIVLGILLIPLEANAASTDSRAGTVATAGSSLNIRSGPSTGNSIVTKLPNGSYVTLISKTGSWWQVEYARNRYGYCHADYIKTVSGDTAKVATNSGSLNVRSGAGTSYARVTVLPKGETVIVLSSSGDWSRILYHGTMTGYVSSQYLEKGLPAFAPVALPVPSYKQTDARWANAAIGASGKTMAQIGCATAAIAMMESYRTGSTIHPDAMSQKLSYTPSGSVYWPSHYTQVTSPSGYINAIYSQLRAGKPVLFGAKNARGGQHWVVITGFTGSALSPAAFTILDPGSSSRTTLQQFLNAYPNFYKYFYY